MFLMIFRKFDICLKILFLCFSLSWNGFFSIQLLGVLIRSRQVRISVSQLPFSPTALTRSLVLFDFYFESFHMLFAVIFYEISYFLLFLLKLNVFKIFKNNISCYFYYCCCFYLLFYFEYFIYLLLVINVDSSYFCLFVSSKIKKFVPKKSWLRFPLLLWNSNTF